ncbi:MAG TPA: Hpt domain-containing protein, partial [Verrucomicrobiae bacterium]|nr:Hpt domain-containing protein [Verrucomicrobiae bacterium]
MPTQPANSSPGSDFMADFYAEADDHLVQIRQGLLKLEEQLGQLALDADSMQRLFRSFHSLKGICGMAGLSEAEQLSHRAEDFLRALSRQELVLNEEGLNCLSAVVQKLEELVIRHREGKAPSDIKVLVDRLSALLRAEQPHSEASGAMKQSASGYPPQVTAKVQTASQQGLKVLLAVFKPAPNLDSRGINIASVRTQLQTLGEILHAAPKVQAGGELMFEFLIAARSEPADEERWKADGIKLTEFRPVPAATPAASDTPAAPNPFIAPSHFVRVELTRLDDLMRIMGDLVVQRARLDEALGRIENQIGSTDSRILNEITHSFSRELRHLRDGLMRIRLVPIAEVFDRLPFVVRDLSRETGKKVRLHLQGQETELDKYLVERLKDPLLHLMRNAISHGIEEPAERASLGKSPEGNITLRASAIGETVLIEVADDGRGIDAARIRERARANGLSVSDEFDSAELLDVLCAPGFSTRDEADLGAGRGIG